jgi:hypothetical protein
MLMEYIKTKNSEYIVDKMVEHNIKQSHKNK